MTDIEDFDKDLTDNLDSLQKSIDSINKQDPSKRTKLLNNCQSQVRSIANRIEEYELEIHSLEKNKSIQYKASLKNIQERFQRLKSELEFKKAEMNNTGNTLFGAPKPVDLKQMNAVELVELGHKVQEDGLESLGRTAKMVNEANVMADDINLELDKQIEQLQRTTNTVKETQVIIKRANEYIKYFAKQLYTDKILMCLMLLIVIAIVVVVGLKIAGKGDSIPQGQDSINNA
jgi:SNARE protein